MPRRSRRWWWWRRWRYKRGGFNCTNVRRALLPDALCRCGPAEPHACANLCNLFLSPSGAPASSGGYRRPSILGIYSREMAHTNMDAEASTPLCERGPARASPPRQGSTSGMPAVAANLCCCEANAFL